MTQQPPEDPHSAETKFSSPLGGPPGGPTSGPPAPPTPPPYSPPYVAPSNPPPAAPPPYPGAQPAQQGWAPSAPQQQPPSWGTPPLSAPAGYGGYAGQPPTKSNLPWILGAVLVVLLLIGAGLGAALLLTGDEEPTSTSSTATDGADPTADEPTADEPTADGPTADEPTDGLTASSAPVAPEPDPEPGDFTAVVAYWKGTYECTQGETALDLTIAPNAEGDGLQALFEFAPTESNPGTATGSYLMAGTFIDGNLDLTGTEWIDNPGLYEQVGLSATISETFPSTITGTVDNPGCSTFTISR